MEFLSFAALHNKNYATTKELGERIGIWRKSKATVNRLNKENAGKGATFGMNFTADQKDEEYKKSLGLDNNQPIEKPSEEEIEE